MLCRVDPAALACSHLLTHYIAYAVTCISDHLSAASQSCVGAITPVSKAAHCKPVIKSINTTFIFSTPPLGFNARKWHPISRIISMAVFTL